jgi:hypothetical protein
MTQNRSADGLQPEVSSVAILPGQRAGFLISKERIIEQLLMPVMPKMFAGTSGADFKLSDTGDSIINSHDRMSFTVKDDDGKTHSARIVSLSLTIIAGELQMDLVTQTDLSAGIRANCHTQTFLGIKLVNNSAGEQTLGFCDARPPLIEHSTDADSGFSVAEEVLIVVAVIAAAVAIVATAGTALALGAVIIGIVAGIGAAGIALSTSAIQLAGNDDAPSISAALLTATAPITWADSADFKLTSAQLNGSLQLSGLFVAKS